MAPLGDADQISLAVEIGLIHAALIVERGFVIRCSCGAASFVPLAQATHGFGYFRQVHAVCVPGPGVPVVL